jgi:hypothetical protein
MTTLELKNEKWIFALILLTLFGCEYPVQFEEPQPLNTSDEASFKTSYQGLYLNMEDRCFLSVTENSIIKKPYIIYAIPKVEADVSTIFVFREDTLFNAYDSNEWLPAKLLNDTIYASWNDTDTVFSISDNNILRYYKGRYFLNYMERENDWKLIVLHKIRKNLSLYSFTLPDSLESLEKIMPLEMIKDNKGKVRKIILKPDKKQIKALLKGDNMAASKTYRKVE